MCSGETRQIICFIELETTFTQQFYVRTVDQHFTINENTVAIKYDEMLRHAVCPSLMITA